MVGGSVLFLSPSLLDLYLALADDMKAGWPTTISTVNLARLSAACARALLLLQANQPAISKLCMSRWTLSVSPSTPHDPFRHPRPDPIVAGRKMHAGGRGTPSLHLSPDPGSARWRQ